MTTDDLLNEHRRQPTRETAARLGKLLRSEPAAILAARPPKSLPVWLSKKHLQDEVDAAFIKAIELLAYVPVEGRDVPDFIRSEIESAIVYLFEPVESDRLARRRGHAARRGFQLKKKGELVAIDGLPENDLDARDRFENEITPELAKMFNVANTQKKKDVVMMMANHEKLGTIREKTKLRGPNIIRLLFDLRRIADQDEAA